MILSKVWPCSSLLRRFDSGILFIGTRLFLLAVPVRVVQARHTSTYLPRNASLQLSSSRGLNEENTFGLGKMSCFPKLVFSADIGMDRI